MKNISSILFLVVSAARIFAQVELVTLSENIILQQQASQKSKPYLQLEKNACGSLGNPDIVYVLAGKTIAIKVQVDTTGLGQVPVNVDCNCRFTQFGNATLSKDTIYYSASDNVNGGEDQIRVQYCDNNNPLKCRSRTYRIVAHRANRTHYQFPITLNPEGIANVTANSSLLPGKKVICATLLDCPDQYAGTAQEISFAESLPTNRIVYQASRFAGTDSVCVVLCDSFMVCDTFKFAFRITGDTLKLPFLDDFSRADPYPDKKYWLDRNVFINNDMAQDPPSFGVATFDGLNSKGTAYGGGFGSADVLTSTYLDLRNAGLTYLSFWLQPRGNADRPELQDSIVLEFKDINGKWVSVSKWEGVPSYEPNTTPLPFRFYQAFISDAFKYKGFQFRFRNYSDRTGILDVWHLDYVRLEETKDSTINDIAFTRAPNFILKRYSSMPWWQFKDFESKELGETIKTGIWNHSATTRLLILSTASLFETRTNIELFRDSLLRKDQLTIPNGMPINRAYGFLNDPDGFSPDVWQRYLSTIKSNEFERFNSLEFRLTYVLGGGQQTIQPGYEAIGRNNSVNRSTFFSNYFAYDDGTAEVGLIAQQNVQVAVAYELNKLDTLRAVQFHFPRTTVNISDQLLDIKVWIGDLDNTPEYEAKSQTATYADIYFDTLQGFTTYPLLQPLILPAGKFFVGWKQVSRCEGTRCIPVGYDRNTPEGTQYLYQNTGSQWVKFASNFLGGALMIRPVMGSVTPRSTPTDELEKSAQNFILFPNPANEYLQITPTEATYEGYNYYFYDHTGRSVQSGVLHSPLSLQDFPAGFYFLKIADQRTNQIWIKKVIIAR